MAHSAYHEICIPPYQLRIEFSFFYWQTNDAMLTRYPYADLQWRLRDDRYFGFAAALNSAGIHWRLSGILKGWDATDGPPAAAKLLADDPAINVLWAENGGGTEALALAAASLPRPIIVLRTDTSPRLEQLLHQPAKNPLLAVVTQSPKIMGRCAAAAAIAALGRQGSQNAAAKLPGAHTSYPLSP